MSILFPGYKSLFATNFMVSGLGVISVYILTMVLPVVIIVSIFNSMRFEMQSGTKIIKNRAGRGL
jgi:hypothetical protein